MRHRSRFRFFPGVILLSIDALSLLGLELVVVLPFSGGHTLQLWAALRSDQEFLASSSGHMMSLTAFLYCSAQWSSVLGCPRDATLREMIVSALWLSGFLWEILNIDGITDRKGETFFEFSFLTCFSRIITTLNVMGHVCKSCILLIFTGLICRSTKKGSIGKSHYSLHFAFSKGRRSHMSNRW